MQRLNGFSIKGNMSGKNLIIYFFPNIVCRLTKFVISILKLTSIIIMRRFGINSPQGTQKDKIFQHCTNRKGKGYLRLIK
jgi:hypothetical protein